MPRCVILQLVVCVCVCVHCALNAQDASSQCTSTGQHWRHHHMAAIRDRTGRRHFCCGWFWPTYINHSTFCVMSWHDRCSKHYSLPGLNVYSADLTWPNNPVIIQTTVSNLFCFPLQNNVKMPYCVRSLGADGPWWPQTNFIKYSHFLKKPNDKKNKKVKIRGLEL